MSSKYHGLPDIDTAQDIFETPDEPDTLLRPADNGLGEDDHIPSKLSNSENIDASGLPGRRKVEKVFGRGTRRRDPKDLSFRPRLPPLSRHTISTSLSSDDDSANDEEGNDEKPQLRESAASRLRRLKAELSQLESELSSQPPPQAQAEGSSSSSKGIGAEGKRKSVLPPKQPINLLSELNELKGRLGKLDIDGYPIPEQGNERIGTSEWNDRLNKLHAINTQRSTEIDGEGEGGSSENVIGTSSDGKIGQESSLGDIDKRLALLEDIIGPVGERLDQNGPLIPTLSKHSHLLSLLTQPRQLDAISRRIKLLLVDLDRASATANTSKRSPGIHQGLSVGADKQGTPSSGPSSSINLTSSEYENLNKLFNLLNRLDSYLPIISPLLIRLKSLNGLHNESSLIADSLRRMKMEDKKNIDEINGLSELLGNLNMGLDNSTQGILKNWESTQGRLNVLEERLKVLEG